MKLKLIENLSRRELLKRTVGTVAATALPNPTKLFNSTKLDKISEINNAQNAIWNLLDSYGISLKHLQKTLPPPQIVVTGLKTLFSSDKAASVIYSAETADNLDAYTNGAYSRELNDYVRRNGAAKTLRQVLKYGLDNVGISVNESMGIIMNGIGKIVPEITRMFPQPITQAIKNGDDATVLKHLKSKGILSKREISDIVRKKREYRRELRKHKKPRQQKDTYDEIDALSRWEGEGGSYFEHRLITALNMIF